MAPSRPQAPQASRVNVGTILLCFALIGVAVWMLNFYAFSDSTPVLKLVENLSHEQQQLHFQLQRRNDEQIENHGRAIRGGADPAGHGRGQTPPAPAAPTQPTPSPTSPPTSLPPTQAAVEADPPQPILQLKKKTTVYILFVDKGGQFNGRRNDRDTVMMREGINAHPMIEMIGEGPGENQAEIDAAAKADFILYPMWGDLNEETCEWGGVPHVCPDLIKNKLVPKEKLAILDFSDGPNRLPWNPPNMAQVVFKRSLVDKIDGSFTHVSAGCGYDTEQPCYPMDYAVRPANYEGLHAASLSDNRKYSIVFLCDPYRGMNEGMIAQISSARLRVKHWLQEMKLPDNAVVGHVGGNEVKDRFMHADIVVTADPASYEGQHALYEALGNGAVVMTNTRWVPMPFPLEHEKHLYYYDLCDTDDAKKKFQDTVRALLAKPAKDRFELRLRAWKHALHHHQAANRMDYVLTTMHNWVGKTGGGAESVPDSLRVDKTGGGPDAVADLRNRCINPTEKQRREGKWLTNHPYLQQG